MAITNAEANTLCDALYKAIGENPSTLAAICKELSRVLPSRDWVTTLTARIVAGNSSPGLSLQWFRDEVNRYYLGME
jgi:hypothetical protein